MKSIFPKSISSYIAILGLLGYPIVAIISSYFGMEGRIYSIALRSIIAIISVYSVSFILLYGNAVESRFVRYFLLIFWGIYLSRLTYDTLFQDDPLAFDVSYYWVWAIGACAIPSIAVASRHYDRDEAERLWLSFMSISFFACIGALVTGSTSVETLYGYTENTGRFRLEGLDPISLGHVGATSAIVAFAGLVARPSAAFSRNLALAIFFGLGLFLGIVSNSRGPLVALTAGLLIVAISGKGAFRFIIPSFAFLAALIVISYSYYIDDVFGTTIYRRMVLSDQIYDESSQARLSLYEGAIRQFIESPLVGSHIEESTFGSYPHNALLESLMAIGVWGLILWAIVFRALHAGVLMAVRVPRMSWLAAVCVQYIVAAQFSGALYSNNTFWTATALLLAIGSSNWHSERRDSAR